MRTAWLCLVLLCIAGCSGTEKNFWRGLTRALCKYNRDCTADYSGGSVSDCAAEMYANGGDVDEFAAGCDYDSKAGRECLAYIRDAGQYCYEIANEPGACANVCGSGSQITFHQLSSTIAVDDPPPMTFGVIGLPTDE